MPLLTMAITSIAQHPRCSVPAFSATLLITVFLYNISKKAITMSWNESQMIAKVYDNFLGNDHANNKPYDLLQWSLWLFDVNSIQ